MRDRSGGGIVRCVLRRWRLCGRAGTVKTNVVSAMKRLACTLAILAAQPLAARQLDVPVETMTLDNGLTVLLLRDASTPTIATNIWYHVGSARERPGRTGFAHLFEHIMFEGSRDVPEGKIDEWFEEAGGSPNGSTNRDRTNYFQTFSSNALDLALFIEANRMGYLLDAMSPASVDGQRDVVKNERRQSYDNRPYGLASQLITEHLYPAGHPYSWPVIGYMDDLTRASYEDVVEFFRTWYTPNNATLAIVGDFDPAEAKRLVRKWFGPLPRGPAVPPEQSATPPLAGETRIAFEDRVQLPRLYLTWRGPAVWGEEEAAAAAVADLLAGGRSSRLYRRLVYELQIADDVRAFNASQKLAGEFQIVATARSGHALDELLTVIDEEIAKVAAEAPTAEELTRIVNQYEVGFLESMESVNGKANQLNAYAFELGEANGFERDLDRFRALDPGDLTAFAREWLAPNRRVILSMVPAGANSAVSGSELLPSANMANSPGAR